jgi:transcriptional regulator with XRE-family HTH domain
MQTERQRLYEIWKATPPAARQEGQQTEEQVAALLGVTITTLRDWERQPEFWMNVFQESRRILGNSIPQVLDALVKKASGGSVTAIKLLLEVLGLHVDKIEQRVHMEDDRLVIVMAPDPPKDPLPASQQDAQQQQDQPLPITDSS